MPVVSLPKEYTALRMFAMLRRFSSFAMTDWAVFLSMCPSGSSTAAGVEMEGRSDATKAWSGLGALFVGIIAN